MSIEAFIEDLQAWALGEDDVLAIGLCGSHARRVAGPTSDIDLVMICQTPSFRLANLDWIGRFGRVGSIQLEDYGLVQSLRTFYRDGQEVEFGIAGKEWCTPPIDPETAQVIADGLRPLYDPSGWLKDAVPSVRHHLANLTP